jgi:hypothetical protein
MVIAAFSQYLSISIIQQVLSGKLHHRQVNGAITRQPESGGKKKQSSVSAKRLLVLANHCELRSLPSNMKEGCSCSPE